MSAYVIAQFDVNDVDMYYEYASKIFETTKGYGGRVFAANDAGGGGGSVPPFRTNVAGVSSLEKARAWDEVPGSHAIIPPRPNSETGDPVLGGRVPMSPPN